MGLAKRDSCFEANTSDKTCLKFYDVNEFAEGTEIESGISEADDSNLVRFASTAIAGMT